MQQQQITFPFKKFSGGDAKYSTFFLQLIHTRNVGSDNLIKAILFPIENVQGLPKTVGGEMLKARFLPTGNVLYRGGEKNWWW